MNDARDVLAALGPRGRLAYRSRRRGACERREAARILVPFTGGSLDPTVLDAAIRIARAEDAVLVPAYLLVVPLEFPLDSPVSSEVAGDAAARGGRARGARAGIPVDARIEKGRTPTHALERLWDVEHFDRIVAPAPART